MQFVQQKFRNTLAYAILARIACHQPSSKCRKVSIYKDCNYWFNCIFFLTLSYPGQSYHLRGISLENDMQTSLNFWYQRMSYVL